MRTSKKINESGQESVPMSEHLVLGSHVRPDIVKLTRNGEYMATWRVDGVAFDCSENSSLNQRLGELNNALAGLGGGQISLWSNMIRRKTIDRLPSDFESNSYGAGLDERYSNSLAGYAMMLTEIYVTLIYRPVGKKTTFFSGLKSRTKIQILADEAESLGALDDAAKQLEASLEKFGLTRLTTYVKDGVEFSGMASLYGFLINGFWEDVPYAPSRLANYLPTATVYFGDSNGLAQTKLANKERFHAFIEIKEFPTTTHAGILNRLLLTPFEWVQTHSFSMKSKRDAAAWLAEQQGRMTAGDEASVSEIDALDDAIDKVRSGAIEMGEYHFVLNVVADTIDQVSNNAADVIGMLGVVGVRAVLSRQIPEYSWLSQVPGSWDKRPRKAVVSSANFSGLNPLHNFPSGRRDGNPWGVALALLRTESGQPFYFNFHAVAPDDGNKFDEKLNGNTFVCGASGVGKTTTVSFLLALATRFQPKMFFYDRGRNSELLVRVLGGTYTNFKEGVPTGINPFQWTDTPTNRKLCVDVVCACVGISGDELKSAQKDEIAKAVATVFGLSRASRRIGAVAQNIQDQDIKNRLERWHGYGDLAWVVDNPANTLDLETAKIIGFDTTDFLGNAETRSVIMLMLLSATVQAMDGTRTIVYMDEFWKLLQDPVFSGFAKDIAKTIRHRSGLGVFVTQSPDDVLQHSIAKTIVEQCVTQIFLPNPRATQGDYIDGFKLNGKEFSLVQGFQETSRKMLIKQGDRSTVVKLDLSPIADDIVVLSGSKDNVAIMDKLIAGHGEDPKVWFPLLMEEVNKRRASRQAGN